MIHTCKDCRKELDADMFRVHKKGYRIGRCKPCEAHYQRQWYAANPEKARNKSRLGMAKRRALKIDEHRAYQNSYRAKHKERINEKVRVDTSRRIFWARALRLRNGITARHLASLWRSQSGLCALSGRRLGRDAEVDHKLPRARGGTDTLTNLQWVTPEANKAKRDLTDAEFLALCQDCARYIGERIKTVMEQ